MNTPFAAAGSQRWLLVAISDAPTLLDEALRQAAAIEKGDTVEWKSPLATRKLAELECLSLRHCKTSRNAPYRSGVHHERCVMVFRKLDRDERYFDCGLATHMKRLQCDEQPFQLGR